LAADSIFFFPAVELGGDLAGAKIWRISVPDYRTVFDEASQQLVLRQTISFGRFFIARR